MVVTRDIEPWDELLQAGRDDERLVTQSSATRGPASGPRSRTSCTRRSRRRSERSGIETLWSHQAEALHAAWAGPTIVTTGTASGKSLCFHLPTLDVLCRDARARALYLYPTKALAQDQARALQRAQRQERAARDLRRRHAARAALRDPPARERRPHQPGHAAPRDPPQPPGVGGLLLQPRGRGGRRGARLPRRVRLARRQRAAPPAPGRRAPTAPSRASCSRAPRSPTPASWPSA